MAIMHLAEEKNSRKKGGSGESKNTCPCHYRVLMSLPWVSGKVELAGKE